MNALAFSEAPHDPDCSSAKTLRSPGTHSESSSPRHLHRTFQEVAEDTVGQNKLEDYTSSMPSISREEGSHRKPLRLTGGELGLGSARAAMVLMAISTPTIKS